MLVWQGEPGWGILESRTSNTNSWIKEAVIIIRKLLSGELAGFNGKVFKIAEHVTAPYPIPKGEIPVLIGTWGPKTASLAGEIADEVKVGGSANPEMGQKIAKFVRKGEFNVGRNSGSVGYCNGCCNCH